MNSEPTVYERIEEQRAAAHRKSCRRRLNSSDRRRLRELDCLLNELEICNLRKISRVPDALWSELYKTYGPRCDFRPQRLRKVQPAIDYCFDLQQEIMNRALERLLMPHDNDD